jgi:hypothetical protein
MILFFHERGSFERARWETVTAKYSPIDPLPYQSRIAFPRVSVCSREEQ